MEQTTLLLEYLKEQYLQARQHETLEANATTFLTGIAGVVLGFALKDGTLNGNGVWVGIIVFLIGLANFRLNSAHFIGNRFHTAVAGRTRRALEEAIQDWTVETPTEIRKSVLAIRGLDGPNISIGGRRHTALLTIPVATMLLGIVITIASKLPYHY